MRLNSAGLRLVTPAGDVKPKDAKKRSTLLMWLLAVPVIAGCALVAGRFTRYRIWVERSDEPLPGALAGDKAGVRPAEAGPTPG